MSEMRQCKHCGNAVETDEDKMLVRHDQNGSLCLGSLGHDHRPFIAIGTCPGCAMTVQLRQNGRPRVHMYYNAHDGRLVKCR